MFFWAVVIVSSLSLRWSSLVSWHWQRDLIWDLPVTPSGSVELDQEAPAIDFSLFFYFKPSTVTVSTQLWPQGCCQFSTDPWDHLYRKDYARGATHSRAPVGPVFALLQLTQTSKCLNYNTDIHFAPNMIKSSFTKSNMLAQTCVGFLTI